MNIWCISKYASPAKYAKVPARLFYFCQEWQKLGHEVHLFTSDSNHLAQFPRSERTHHQENIEGVWVHWFKTKKYKTTASVARIVSWFDFERRLFGFKHRQLNPPDVVLVSSLSILSIVYGYYLKRKYGATLVFEIRDIWPLTMTEEGGFSKYHPLTLFIGAIEKFGYQVADLIVGTMPGLNKHVKNVIHKDFNFHCAPLGFHPDNYKAASLDNNAFVGRFPENKTIVGYAGSMGITNALEPFIEAIYDLQHDARFYFVLVGSGDLRAGFEERLKECTNVVFLPRIEQSQVKDLLAYCDVLYLSTNDSKVWEYGQSMNKVVEYMLAAKPIIASYTGYPSMINEAECGYFLTPQDGETPKEAIIRALSVIGSMSQAERQVMGERGKQWIYQHRSYSLLAQQYLAKIESISNG
ncbi:glycosyltransferase involved in cell wall biosynthesis [Neisseria sp. HSC-16F19]|nr:glycosyltransferase family 4 protein [Neisseria sp. HSC-16F19]MCP2041415.1 glycosyltransferase involved in cell wall biosynthesis [Neisseria sp. HSC-16F19]